MKNTHEIIDETAGYYNLLNRSISLENGSVSCLYNGPEGKQCAFARICIDPSNFREGLRAGVILNRYGESILKPEYRGHDFSFYSDIQDLHDRQSYWTNTGLSELGKERVEKLKLDWPIPIITPQEPEDF